jgi:hypothetical protein
MFSSYSWKSPLLRAPACVVGGLLTLSLLAPSASAAVINFTFHATSGSQFGVTPRPTCPARLR